LPEITSPGLSGIQVIIIIIIIIQVVMAFGSAVQQ
jgi:hypothetical protein